MEHLSFLYRCLVCDGAVMWVINNARGMQILGHVIAAEAMGGGMTLYLARVETHSQVAPCTCQDLD